MAQQIGIKHHVGDVVGLIFPADSSGLDLIVLSLLTAFLDIDISAGRVTRLFSNVGIKVLDLLRLEQVVRCGSKELLQHIGLKYFR